MTKWVFCPKCAVDRAYDSLEGDNCPYCETQLLNTPPEPDPLPLETAETAESTKTTVVKPGRKRKLTLETPPPSSQTPATLVLPSQADKIFTDAQAEAMRMPFEAPQARIDPDIDREFASRQLCRRRLMPFIKKFRPKYNAGWVHEDICRRLEQFVRDVEAGLAPRLLLMLPPRAGKQLADDTIVPTPKGWTTHGALRPGDEVFHPSGKPTRIVAVSEKTKSDVRVEFSDGSVFYCHENHEWTLYNRGRGEWQTIAAGHFLAQTRFGLRKQVMSSGRCCYQLPSVEAIQFPGNEYTMHPYVLGAWLGDGSASKPCITGTREDHAIVAKIVSLGYPVSTVCTHTTTGVLTTYFSGDGVTDIGLVPKRQGPIPGRMSQELRSLHLFNWKRIPPSYQTLSVELRLELLAGLVDTDGTTDKNSRISITTVDHMLATDIMQLCTGLGFRPYLREVQPKLSTSGIQGKRVCYIVGFQPTMDIPVALERKLVTRKAPQKRVGLVSVERVTDSAQQGHCIQVDSPDGLYVVGKQLIATHNSEIGSRHLPAWALGKHPEWEIIAASHTSSLTMSFSRYVRDLVRDPAYTAVFPETRLDPGSQSIENWNIAGGGGYLAAGVGTGITGRGCFLPATPVVTHTPGGKCAMIPISTIRVGDYVYGYDHEKQEHRSVRVVAVSASRTERDIVSVSGVECTDDHEFCTSLEGGYTRASALTQDMPLMRLTEGQVVEDMPVLLQPRPADTLHREDMSALQSAESRACLGMQEVPHRDGGSSAVHRPDVQPLQQGVLSKNPRARGCTAKVRSWAYVLFSSVLQRISKATQTYRACLRRLRSGSHKVRPEEILHTRLLPEVESKVGNKQGVLWGVLRAEEATTDSERTQMLYVQPAEVHSGSTPYRSRRREQQGEQLGVVMLSLSQVISQQPGCCAEELVESIQDTHGELVVDIQTETGNFFVGEEGLLVHNCHILLLDDLVKDIEAADSQTISDSTWEWYASTAYTRLAPGGGVLGIMTWWHDSDWAGRIQQVMAAGEGDVFEIVKYPAINDMGDEYRLPNGNIVQFAENELVPEGSTLTRVKNTAIHPERYTTAMMLRIKANLYAAGQQRVWSSLYQQNPAPEDGLYFTKDMFRSYSTLPPREKCNVYQAWDFAITEGTESDYTVGVTVYQDEHDSIYVADIARFKSGDSFFIIDQILDYAAQWHPTLIGFEDGQIWKALQSLYDKRVQERRQYEHSYEILKPLTDKLVRASPLRGRMQQGKVYFDEKAPWYQALYHEMTRFPAGKHDDCNPDDTMIECPLGPVMIGLLKDGDEVLTYDGSDVLIGIVSEHHCTGVKLVLEMMLDDGIVVKLTPGHPVLTSTGYVYAGDLTSASQIVRKDICKFRDTALNGRRKQKGTTSRQQPSTGSGCGCTSTRTHGSTESSWTARTSTTRTGIKTTTSWVTYSVSRLKNMLRSTLRNAVCWVRLQSSCFTSSAREFFALKPEPVSTSAAGDNAKMLSGPAHAPSAVKSSFSSLATKTPPRIAPSSVTGDKTLCTQQKIMRSPYRVFTAVQDLFRDLTVSGTRFFARINASTSTGTRRSTSPENANAAVSPCSSPKGMPQGTAYHVQQPEQSTSTRVLVAGERFYPSVKMTAYTAVENVLTSCEDLTVTQRSTSDTSRLFVRVVSIREIGYHPTYNFEVAGTRNFLVERGVVVHNCVDSLGWAVRLMLTRAAPRPTVRHDKLKSWKDKLPGLMSVGGGHMSA